MDKIFLKECFLQKTNRYEALEELSNDKNALDPGTPLCLCFDEDLDKEQKLVFAKKTINDNEGKTIGVLSDEDAKDINPSLIPDNYFQQFLGVFVGLTVCLSAKAS